jgi:hypothetical protein
MIAYELNGSRASMLPRLLTIFRSVYMTLAGKARTGDCDRAVGLEMLGPA